MTPESDPVVRLPAGLNWKKMDAIMVLRKTLKASYIPLCVCDYILQNLCVIQQVPPGVGKVLDSCRAWTGCINDNEPVCCVAVQPSSGCPKDMDMYIVLTGNALDLMWTQLM